MSGLLSQECCEYNTDTELIQSPTPSEGREVQGGKLKSKIYGMPTMYQEQR